MHLVHVSGYLSCASQRTYKKRLVKKPVWNYDHSRTFCCLHSIQAILFAGTVPSAASSGSAVPAPFGELLNKPPEDFPLPFESARDDDNE